MDDFGKSSDGGVTYTLTITYGGTSYCELIKNTSESNMDYLIDVLAKGDSHYVMRGGWVADVFDTKPKRIVFPKNVLLNSVIHYT